MFTGRKNGEKREIYVLLISFFFLILSGTISPFEGHSLGPVFIEEPPTTLDLVDSSHGLTITCVGEGNPRPTIQWLDQNYQPITRISGYR